MPRGAINTCIVLYIAILRFIIPPTFPLFSGFFSAITKLLITCGPPKAKTNPKVPKIGKKKRKMLNVRPNIKLRIPNIQYINKARDLLPI